MFFSCQYIIISLLLSGTKDFIRHTSQIANPKCPQRFVPSFQVLLLGRRSPRDVYKLRAQPTDASQCSAQCCRSRDCSLSFIEDDVCFGVTGASGNGTNSEQGSRIGLQIAIIDRNKGWSVWLNFKKDQFINTGLDI